MINFLNIEVILMKSQTDYYKKNVYNNEKSLKKWKEKNAQMK